MLILPLLAVTGFSIAPVIKPFIGPLPTGSLSNEWENGVCLQSSPSTCGVASMATILQHFGEEVSEPVLAAEPHSYVGGTEVTGYAQFDFEKNFGRILPLPTDSYSE
ncbi:MAG: hypothetical protein ACI9OD_001309 [Limisphaerales bacterium]|jgi:hypothetical protein